MANGKPGRPKGLPPDDKRCIATARTADPPRRCGQYALKGKTTCRYHGGKGGAPKNPAISHGLTSRRIKRLTRHADKDELVERLISDPDLFDMAKPIAVARSQVEKYLRMDLDEDSLREWLIDKHKEQKGYKPTIEEVEALRERLLVTNLRAMNIITNMQARARKALTQEQLVAAVVVPHITQLGQRFMEAVKRHVTPEQMARIQLDIGASQNQTILDISVAVEG